MKILKNFVLALAGAVAVLFTVYWFNLDNKLIFYVVRPLLNKLYNRQKRDVRL